MNHRTHSRPLDVHTWSGHAEINLLVDRMWSAFGEARQSALTPKGNRQGTQPKRLLKVLLVHLYATYLDDPTLWTGVPRSKNSYVPTSRYNQLHISFKIVPVIDYLIELDYVDFVNGSNDRTHNGWHSFTSRIRPSRILQAEFGKCTATLFDINKHHNEVAVILSDFDTDVEGNLITRRGKKLRKLIEYEDTPETQRMELQLKAYNELLRNTYIDIATLEIAYIDRQTKKGNQRVPINQTNKFVRRIFSRGSWTLNGRYYGGFWQQVGAEYRKHILINDMPTIEVDYKGIHPSILSINRGKTFNGYDVGRELLPNLTKEQQRKAIKLLVLTAINAASKSQAYKAFRSNSDISLKDYELDVLLTGFLKLNPHLKEDLFTNKGIELMYQDSKIVEYVINKFTQSGVPVLSVHDSFLIQHNKVLDLKRYMIEASEAVLGKALDFDQDYYDSTEAVQFRHLDVDYYNTLMSQLPEVVRTYRYETTYNKFKLWIERNDLSRKPYTNVASWIGQKVK